MDQRNLTSCVNCPRGGPRVGWRGNPEADIVLIGEGPGNHEVIKGRPFIGPSGELLQNALPEGIVLDRDCLVTNSIQCFFHITSKDKSKVAFAVSVCRDNVMSLIRRHPRKVIITLGNWAAESVLGESNFKITQRRGEELQAVIDGEVIPVIPTYHPAFLLRGGGHLQTFKDDLKKGVSIARGDHHRKFKVPIELHITGADHLQQVFDEVFRDYPYLAVDTETSSLNPFDGYILSHGLYPTCDHKSGDDPLEHDFSYIISKELMQDRKVIEVLDWAFKSRRWKYIWHNGKFDVRWFWHIGVAARVDEDSLLCGYAHNEASAGGLDLETLARDILDAPDYKDEVKKYLTKKSDSFEKIPVEILNKRLALDVLNTAGVWCNLRRKMDEHLHKLVDKTLYPASNFLARVEEAGIGVDHAVIDANEQRLTVEANNAAEQFISVATSLLPPGADPLGSINLNAPNDVAYVLYDRLGIKIKNRRPPNTRKETLAKLEDHVAVKALLKYRKTFKALSTYVYPFRRRALASHDGRIHTTYVLHRTPTGRLASRDPNVQNIPRDPMLRGMLAAPLGRILLEADYNTAELRMLAVVSYDEFLTGVFLDDKRNLHDEVSVKMYGPDFTPDNRIRAKAINFGIPYGREAFSIAEEFEIPTIEAQEMINAWFAAAPGAHRFILACRNAPQAGRSLITVFGRKLRPGVVSSERLRERQNQFANFPMQSPISDFCVHSAIELEEPLKEYDTFCVNLVHDSLVFEAPDDPAIYIPAAKKIKYVMEDVPKHWVDTEIIFKADFKIGRNWGQGIEGVNEDGSVKWGPKMKELKLV